MRNVGIVYLFEADLILIWLNIGMGELSEEPQI